MAGPWTGGRLFWTPQVHPHIWGSSWTPQGNLSPYSRTKPPGWSWAKDLMALNKTTQENLECFVHYRNLQRSLLISLKKGRNHFRSVSISHQLVGELNWWASGGMRANRISPWCPPIPTLQIWMDACLYGRGGKTDRGSHFQYTWTEQEKGKHINWLELRAAQYALLELASPREVVQFHIDNMTAIVFIRRLRGHAP